MLTKSSDVLRPRRLSKLSPPRLSTSVFPRSRLHGQIRQALQDGAALWIHGPAGAGKTTLVAGYLEAEHCPAIWYQIDAADAESATFFRHAGMTLTEPDAGRALPLFDPRFGRDPVRFAAGFFQAYFDALAPGTVVVFDDYHEVGAGSLLDAIMITAIAQLTEDRHLIFISRDTAPEVSVRLQAEGRLQILGWPSLRLEDDEARHIVRLHMSREKSGLAEQLNHFVQGWVAGLVLMLQQDIPAPLPAEAMHSPMTDSINEYFATQLFSQQKEAELDALIRLSLFADFTPEMAEAMMAGSGVHRLVQRMHRRSFFLTRYQDENTDHYRFHPLFLNYLRQEFAVRLPMEEQTMLRLRAADILAGQGAVAEAVRLYQAAETWPQAEALLIAEAPRMYRHGDFGALRKALDRLPAARVDRSAWLLMWRGEVASVNGARLGRPDLERAYALFREAEDLTGALVTWCAIVEGYIFEWGDFHPLDRWIEVFDELEPALAHAPPPIKYRATVAMFGALFNRRPFEPKISEWAKRTEEVFLNTVDSLTRALVASNLAYYYAFTRGQMGKAAAFVNEIRMEEGHGFNNPIADVVFLGHFAVVNLWSTGDVAASLVAVHQGIDRVKETGVHMMDFLLYAVGAWTSIAAGEYKRADWFIEELGHTFNHDALLNRCVYHDSRAILHIHRGNVELARAESEISLELARRGGMPYAECACLLTTSFVHGMAGEWTDAEHYRQRAAEIATAMDNQLVLNHLDWFEAADLLRQGRIDASIAPLRKALKSGRIGNYFANLWMDYETFARLCHVALIHDIEANHVRRLIGNLGVRALDPEWERDGWPYLFRIKVLTGLQVTVLREGRYQPLAVQGRSGELLAALVWLGGQNVSQQRLGDLLWPDADGDAARRSFDTTLHRLRRILGNDRLLTLDGGQLSLDPGLYWSDLGDVEVACRALIRAQQASNDQATAEAQAFLIDRVGELPAPGQQGGAFEAIAATLQRDVESALARAGQYWQQRQAWQDAVQALEAWLRLNPVVELPYIQLMQVYLASGMAAEAAATYERCRENIKQAFGIEPGNEIESLYRQLRDINHNN